MEFLVNLTFIREDYAMWKESAEMVVTLVHSWPDSIEPPSSKMIAFAERKFGLRQFLPRWTKNKVESDIDRYLNMAVMLGTILELRTMEYVLSTKK